MTTTKYKKPDPAILDLYTRTNVLLSSNSRDSEALTLVCSPEFTRLRAELSGNAESVPYGKMTQVIRAALESLYEKEELFQIVTVTGHCYAPKCGEYSLSSTSLTIDNEPRIYFKSIVEVKPIGDTTLYEDSVIQDRGLDKFQAHKIHNTLNYHRVGGY